MVAWTLSIFALGNGAFVSRRLPVSCAPVVPLSNMSVRALLRSPFPHVVGLDQRPIRSSNRASGLSLYLLCRCRFLRVLRPSFPLRSRTHTHLALHSRIRPWV